MDAERLADADDGPWVSMLLLTYNQAAFVGEAIAGALAQTYARVEIIVSDDASSDGTDAVIRAAVAGYEGPHRIVLNRNTTNLGIGANLNRMIELSQGELFVVAAGDDVSLPDRCARLVDVWIAHDRGPDLIASNVIDIDADGAAHGIIAPTDLATYRAAADWLARPPHVIGAAQLWTRRLFERFGSFPPGATAEDMLMVFRAIVSGGALTLAEPLVRYRRGGISRRQRSFDAAGVRARLLKNNRSALVELPQLLADARTAGQIDAVQPTLQKRLAREHFIRDAFAADRIDRQLAIAWGADAVPLTTRLRVLAYAAFPGLLTPWFAAKRLLTRSE